MDDARAVVGPHLRAGEQVVWTGRPDPGVLFAPGDLFLIPFGLLWTGFVCIWEYQAVSGNSSAFFALWGVSFLVLGAYMLVGRFVYKRARKRRTTYAITDRRALAVRDRSVEAMPLRREGTSVRTSRDGRRVSVTWGSGLAASVYGNSGMEFFAQGRAPFGFYDVADVDGLQRALASVD